MMNNVFQNVKMKFIAIIIGLPSGNIFAAGDSDFPPGYYDIVAIVLLLIVIAAFLGLIYFESRREPVGKKGSVFLRKLTSLLNRSVPVEKESEILFDHEYDGIKELDSKIPPWFTGLFWVTILFSIYYMLNFHVFNTGKLMYEEYEEEMQIAALQKAELMNTGALLTEETVTRLIDDVSLLVGKEIYDINCVACHANDGGGLVGPNFTDEYWIHGGGIKNIFKTIKYGIPAKGMISWQTQLNPIQIQQVASYIMSMQGTTSLAPKDAEGEIWIEPDSENAGDDTNQ
jgi:cytochrome c oxidase cbb3-type subunit 3